ncbi:GNAT family N-acetyltransferase [Rhodopseudomonas parapalustris]
MTATASFWRPMTAADLPAVNAIAAVVHAAYPEDAAVFTERLALYPDGCLVLENADGPAGYLISHPWHLMQPPALNALLGSVPRPASTYYLHDIALLPQARGGGAAGAALAILFDHAAAVADNVSLVAVGGTVPFWGHYRFAPNNTPSLARKLQSYGTDANYMIRPLIAPHATGSAISPE